MAHDSGVLSEILPAKARNVSGRPASWRRAQSASSSNLGLTKAKRMLNTKQGYKRDVERTNVKLTSKNLRPCFKTRIQPPKCVTMGRQSSYGGYVTKESVWGFPKIGVPPNHHPFQWDFPQQKPSIWGYPHDYGNPHMKVHMFFSFCWPGLPTLRWQFLPPQGQLATTSTLDLPQSSTQPLCHWSKTAKTDSDWSSENLKCSFVIHFEIQQDVISSFWISLTQSHAAFLHFAAVPA